MESKKSPKVDLERRRFTFMLIGFLFSISGILVAFEYKFPEAELEALDEIEEEEEILEMVDPTVQEEKIEPPPPEETVVEEIEIVDDETEVEDEVEIMDSEADQETVVEEVVIPDVEEVEEEVDNSVYQFVNMEEPPEFPGGQQALAKWLAQNTVYPEQAKAAQIEGRVFVQFVIGKSGQVTNVKILRGTHPLLDNEALRVVRSMPAWKPGKQRGKAVMVQYQVPIRFKLR